MPWKLVFIALIAAAPACAQPAAEPVPAQAAPAIKAGTTVTDRTGVVVGVVTAITESPTGPMVVVEIDGKMVSLPQATLIFTGQTAASAQTKAEMLAAAGAPG